MGTGFPVFEKEKEMMKRSKLFRGISGILLVVTASAVCVTSAMNFLFPSRIHEFLGTSSRGDGSGDESAQYFKSAYASSTEMVEAKLKHIYNSVAEGIVLLKNENEALPLASEQKITLLGQSSANLHYNAGSGASKVSAVEDDLATAFKKAGITVNPEMNSFYASQPGRTLGGHDEGAPSTIGEVNPSNFTASATSTLGQYKDAAVVVFAREYGEGNDVPMNGSKAEGYDFDGSGLALTVDEQAVLAWAKEQNFKKIIVVLNTDNAISIGSMKEDEKIDAILQVGGVGYNGADALADVIKGKVNPSGHLVATYARDAFSSPATVNFGDYTYTNADEINAGVTAEDKNQAIKYIVEAEGIYVGYQYYETRYADLVEGNGNASSVKGSTDGKAWDYDKEMGYVFGYGLSYTTFEETIKEFKIDGTKGSISVEVENTGSVSGKDVVQLYVSTPYGDYEKQNKVEKSAIRLLNFEKTKTLDPGEKQELTVEIDLSQVASYDAYNAKTYIMSEGDHFFAIGNGAHEAINNVLAAKGYSTKDGMTENGDESKVKVWNNRALDATTYSVSEATGKTITNLFDDADLNDWIKDKVTYLSRSDWDKTYPVSYTGLTATKEMILRLNGDPDANGYDYTPQRTKEYAKGLSAENIGSTESSVKIIELKGKEYDDPLWETMLNQITLDEMASFLGKGNSFTQKIPSIGYKGTDDGDGPAGFLGNVDYNGTRIPTRIYSGQATAAASWNKELLKERGEFMGEDGLYLRKTSIWAPGANIHRTPFSGRNVEYYSEDGMLSYQLAAVQTSGMQGKGIITCVKHYAVNEQETNRGGISTFTTEQQIREIACKGFEGAVVKGGARGLMGSFNRIGVDFSGQHPGLMDGLLREEWGLQGYVITDEAGYTYMQHTNAVIAAGTDIFDSTAPRIVKKIRTYLDDYLADGDYTYYAACRQATHRILYAYANSNAMNGYTLDGETSSGEQLAWWQIACVALDAALICATLAVLALYTVSLVKEGGNKA